MSKSSISFAVIILASALSAPAYAHGKGGGGGGGGGHHAGGGGGGGGHYHAIGGGGGVRHFSAGGGSSRWSGRSSSRGSRLAARSLSTRSAGALHTRSARLASAGWRHHGHHGRFASRFGWVGPLFWPFAYYDFYDYLWWGDDYDDAFWGYGYGGIFAGMFSPYGYGDLAAYQPRSSGGNANAPASQLTQLCDEDNRNIGNLPIDRFQQSLQLSDAQKTALDELANASLKAGQSIKAACPADIALTAPGRLANMQARIEAMIAAGAIVQPPLKKFYDLLNDEQKAKLAALGSDRQRKPAAVTTTASIPQTCGTSLGVPDWPAAEIDRTLHPTEAQRARLTALQAANAKAEDMLKGSCQADNALTPPARLAAVGKRLDIMLQAVKTVRSALNDFYATLSDEQKVRFEALGPQQMGQGEQTATQSQSRRHRYSNVSNIIRQLMTRF
jgi:hypothetical protein